MHYMLTTHYEYMEGVLFIHLFVFMSGQSETKDKAFSKMSNDIKILLYDRCSGGLVVHHIVEV